MPRTRVRAIRHAEKPTPDGAVQGVSASGLPNPDELSVRGWQRAGALEPWSPGALVPWCPGAVLHATVRAAGAGYRTPRVSVRAR